MKKIDFTDDSQLQIIEQSAFHGCTSITSLNIPSSLEIISKQAFAGCLMFQIMEIPENSRLKILNKDMFDDSSICLIMIPSNLRGKIKFIE